MRIRRRRQRWAASDIGGATDVGHRDENQDRWAVDPAWAVVCDGVGGHTGGATAAELARNTVAARLGPLGGGFAGDSLSGQVSRRRFAGDSLGRDATVVLRRAAGAANDAVVAGRSTAPDRADMATTLTVAVRHGPRRWVVLQVGDSPAWVVGPATARSVTWDHNLVGDLVRAGALTAEEAVGHKGRHVITRAIGIGPTVEPELFTVDLEPDEALVLASDGLSDVASPAEVVPLVAAAPDAATAARDLVALALERGTRDNVTVVVIR